MSNEKMSVEQAKNLVGDLIPTNSSNNPYIEKVKEIDIPFDLVELPTLGNLYPTKTSSLKIGYLTAEDENILTSPNLLKNGTAIDILIKRKMLDSPISYENLYLGDRNAIILFLRATAFGDKFEQRMIDPKTGEEFDGIIDLSKIKFKTPMVEHDENGLYTYTQKNGNVIKFKNLTVGEENDINKQNEEIKKVKGGFDQTLTLKMLKQIVSVNDNKDKMYIERFIKHMMLKDSIDLRKFMANCEYDLDLSVEVEAPSNTNFQYNGLSILGITLSLFEPYF